MSSTNPLQLFAPPLSAGFPHPILWWSVLSPLECKLLESKIDVKCGVSTSAMENRRECNGGFRSNLTTISLVGVDKNPDLGLYFLLLRWILSFMGVGREGDFKEHLSHFLVCPSLMFYLSNAGAQGGQYSCQVGGLLHTVDTKTYFWNKCTGDETLVHGNILRFLPGKKPTPHHLFPQAQSPGLSQFTQRPHPPPGVAPHHAPLSTCPLHSGMRGTLVKFQAIVRLRWRRPPAGGRGLRNSACGDKENTDRIRKGVGSGSWELVKVGPGRGCRRILKGNLLETDLSLHTMRLLPLPVEVC